MKKYRIVEHGIAPDGYDVITYLETTDTLVALIADRHYACLVKVPDTAGVINKLGLLEDITNLCSKASMLLLPAYRLYLADSVNEYLTYLASISSVVDHTTVIAVVTHHIVESKDRIEDWLEEHYLAMYSDEDTVAGKVELTLPLVPDIITAFETMVNKVIYVNI